MKSTKININTNLSVEKYEDMNIVRVGIMSSGYDLDDPKRDELRGDLIDVLSMVEGFEKLRDTDFSDRKKQLYLLIKSLKN